MGGMRPSKRGLARSDYAQAVVSSTMAIKIGTTWIVMSSPFIERLSKKFARDRWPRTRFCRGRRPGCRNSMAAANLSCSTLTFEPQRTYDLSADSRLLLRVKRMYRKWLQGPHVRPLRSVRPYANSVRYTLLTGYRSGMCIKRQLVWFLSAPSEKLGDATGPLTR